MRLIFLLLFVFSFGVSDAQVNKFFIKGKTKVGHLAEVVDYNSRVVTDGGTLTDAELGYLDRFVSTLKTESIWTKLTEVSTFMGGFNGCDVKLKYADISIQKNTFTNFVSGDYTSAGLKAISENRKISTGLIPSTYSLGQNNFSAGYFMTEPVASTTYFYMTDTKSSGVASFILGNNQTSAGSSAARLVARTTTPYWQSISLGASRMEAMRDYQNSYSSLSNTAPPSVTLDTEVTIFGTRSNGTNLFSNGTIGFAFVGQYLTEAEIKILHNAVKVLLISLGRYSESSELLGFGDSITYGSSASPFSNRWTLILSTSLGLRERNLGISGSRYSISSAGTPGGFDRRTEIYNYNILGGSIICIQYGVNDILVDTGDGNPTTIATYKSKLIQQIDELIALGIPKANIIVGSASLLLGSVPTARQVAWSDATREAAVDTEVKFADVYNYMVANGGSSLIDVDNVHPNNSGHAAIRDAYLAADFVF